MSVESPEGLGGAGGALWASLAAERPSMGAAERVLVERACRAADRLARLDAQLDGRDTEWLRVQQRDDDAELVVVVDRALAEVRQQDVALKTVLAELRQSKPATDMPAARGDVDELRARRAARRDASGQ